MNEQCCGDCEHLNTKESWCNKYWTVLLFNREKTDYRTIVICQIAKLQAENDRYKTALKRIAETKEVFTKDENYGYIPRWETMRQIARDALKEAADWFSLKKNYERN